MSVFETFTLLFKADSTQLKKELDDVKKRTDGISETFKETEEQTKKTDNQFINLAKSLGSVATAYFSVGAIVGSLQATMAKTSTLALSSKNLGIPVEELSAWSDAVQRFGGDASDVESALTSLAEKFKTTPAFALEYLPGLADELKRRDAALPGEAQRFAQTELGLSPAFISWLMQGKEAVLADIGRQREIGVVTSKDAESTRKFNESADDLANSLNELSRIVIQDLLPKITPLIQALTDLVSTYTEFRSKTKSLSDVLSPSEIIFRLEKNKNKTEEPKKKYPNVPGVVDDENAPKKIIQLSPLKRNHIDYINKDIVEEGPHAFYIPPNIAPVSNSQSRTLSFGDININTTAQDAKMVGMEVMAQIEKRENQFMQSNSQFDNSVIV